ncbi:universal stress protein [Jatrophihabitans endophyticus]|uniref:universal stress protein n=1 Tax=Jatrophihabitans endophyticus TaxID=1206085 RepID=UPI001A033E3C|nr:universal stress protein [Jatrophihabitans endophyticus]MBE7189164.1 universal stress protein [Jatrophihabitans endophyticus]
MSSYSTVVVGTDGSDTSFRAVDRAAELARDAGATLVIACAYLPEKVDTAAQDALGDDAYQVVGSAPADDTVSRAKDRAAARGATAVETVSVQGKPAASLRSVVEDRSADLLVVGNVGLNTLAGRILGSVPLEVARHSGVDVLIVHTS